jgi:hypothetical protein
MTAITYAEPLAPTASPIVLPGLRGLARHALPGILEAIVAPTIILYFGLVYAGFWGGLTAALAWSYGSIARRYLSGQRIGGLLVLAALSLSGRTLVAGISGSLSLYFVQPVLGEAALGVIFLATAATRESMAARLAGDFVPLGDLHRQPAMRQFFAKITMLWGATFLLNSLLGMWMLLGQSAETYVLTRSVVSTSIKGLAILASVVCFRRSMRRRGIGVQFG